MSCPQSVCLHAACVLSPYGSYFLLMYLTQIVHETAHATFLAADVASRLFSSACRHLVRTKSVRSLMAELGLIIKVADDDLPCSLYQNRHGSLPFLRTEP